MSDQFKNSEEVVECVHAAFSHDDAVGYVEQYRAEIERAATLAVVEQVRAWWLAEGQHDLTSVVPLLDTIEREAKGGDK